MKEERGEKREKKTVVSLLKVKLGVMYQISSDKRYKIAQ